MRVLIRNGTAVVPQALRLHAERRIGLALGRFADRIARVSVRFSGAGTERQCRIEVSLRPSRLRVEDTDADPFAAMNRAADRALRSVTRALEREGAGAEDPTRPLSHRRGR